MEDLTKGREGGREARGDEDDDDEIGQAVVKGGGREEFRFLKRHAINLIGASRAHRCAPFGSLGPLFLVWRVRQLAASVVEDLDKLFAE